MPIIGHIVAHKSGHGLNALMVSKLMNSPMNWVLIGAAGASALRQEYSLQEAAVL
jgi:UDP-3-O-acyl-N-acetylglucosamine deacetylase